MKKVLLVLVLMMFVFLTACIQKPHEECVTEWTESMEDRSIFFVSYTAYIITTEYGDVDVTKRIYESAQLDEYSKICIMVNPKEDNDFLGGTLIDGTPIPDDVVDEIADQLIPYTDEPIE